MVGAWALAWLVCVEKAHPREGGSSVGRGNKAARGSGKASGACPWGSQHTHAGPVLRHQVYRSWSPCDSLPERPRGWSLRVGGGASVAVPGWGQPLDLPPSHRTPADCHRPVRRKALQLLPPFHGAVALVPVRWCWGAGLGTGECLPCHLSQPHPLPISSTTTQCWAWCGGLVCSRWAALHSEAQAWTVSPFCVSREKAKGHGCNVTKPQQNHPPLPFS